MLPMKSIYFRQALRLSLVALVASEIMATLTLGWIMRHFLNNNHLTVVLLGGACLILAAILMRQVPGEEAEAA
jgi:ABC-type proline/glycine betaine transport system permease subunit